MAEKMMERNEMCKICEYENFPEACKLIDTDARLAEYAACTYNNQNEYENAMVRAHARDEALTQWQKAIDPFWAVTISDCVNYELLRMKMWLHTRMGVMR